MPHAKPGNRALVDKQIVSREKPLKLRMPLIVDNDMIRLGFANVIGQPFNQIEHILKEVPGRDPQSAIFELDYLPELSCSTAILALPSLADIAARSRVTAPPSRCSAILEE